MNSSGWSFWMRIFRLQDELLPALAVELLFILMYGFAWDRSTSLVISRERYPESMSSALMVPPDLKVNLRSAFTSCTPNLWSCFQPLELRPTRIRPLSRSTAKWTLMNFRFAFRFAFRFPFRTRIHWPYWFSDSPVASIITVILRPFMSWTVSCSRSLR